MLILTSDLQKEETEWELVFSLPSNVWLNWPVSTSWLVWMYGGHSCMLMRLCMYVCVCERARTIVGKSTGWYILLCHHLCSGRHLTHIHSPHSCTALSVQFFFNSTCRHFGDCWLTQVKESLHFWSSLIGCACCMFHGFKKKSIDKQ